MSMPPNPWVIEPKAKPLHSGLKYLVLQVFKHQTHADMKLLGTTLELPAATTSCDLCAKCCPFTPIPRNLDCTKTLALLAAKSSDEPTATLRGTAEPAAGIGRIEEIPQEDVVTSRESPATTPRNQDSEASNYFEAKVDELQGADHLKRAIQLKWRLTTAARKAPEPNKTVLQGLTLTLTSTIEELKLMTEDLGALPEVQRKRKRASTRASRESPRDLGSSDARNMRQDLNNLLKGKTPSLSSLTAGDVDAWKRALNNECMTLVGRKPEAVELDGLYDVRVLFWALRGLDSVKDLGSRRDALSAEVSAGKITHWEPFMERLDGLLLPPDIRNQQLFDAWRKLRQRAHDSSVDFKTALDAAEAPLSGDLCLWKHPAVLEDAARLPRLYDLHYRLRDDVKRSLAAYRPEWRDCASPKALIDMVTALEHNGHIVNKRPEEKKPHTGAASDPSREKKASRSRDRRDRPRTDATGKQSESNLDSQHSTPALYVKGGSHPGPPEAVGALVASLGDLSVALEAKRIAKKVRLRIPDGSQVEVRALVDSGCSINLIRKDLAHAFGFTVKPSKQRPHAKFLNNHLMTGADFTGFDAVLGFDWLHCANALLTFRPCDFVYGDDPAVGKGAIRFESRVNDLIGHVERGEQALIAYLTSLGDHAESPPTTGPHAAASRGRIVPLWRPPPKTGTEIAVAEAFPEWQRLRQLCEGHEDLKDLPSQAFHTLVAAISDEELPEWYEPYDDVFDGELAGALAQHSEHDHAIDLEANTAPPHLPIYNLSGRELDVLREYLDKALEKGWIRPSKSPAGAPILFVPKADGSLRLYIDYRGLNKITVKNRYPLPLISELMDRLSRASIYTKLDLRDAYYRLRIREGDEWKTAFRTRYGHYEYTVMPFGLANAPASFQSYIYKALGGLLDNICVVYLDDILIYSDNEEEHIEHVRMVLERLRDWKLYAKRSKCTFHTKTVEFLGFIISPRGIHMDPARVQAIAEWPEPKAYRDIQVFLGFANFYRRFIHNYSLIARPLNDLVKLAQQEGAQTGKKKDLKHLKRGWEWPEAAAESFRELRGAFSKAPCMVITDASDAAHAGILLQPQQDDVEGRQTHWHPIAYHSQSFKGAARNYEVHDKELMAIVECFRVWRHYLEGAQHPAEWLAAFDFEIEYKKGETNPADGPSRRPDYFDGFREETITANRNLLLLTLQQKLGRKGAETAPAEETRANGDAEPNALTIASSSRHYEDAAQEPDQLQEEANPELHSPAPEEGASRSPPGDATDDRSEQTAAPVASTEFAQSLVPRSDAAVAAEDETSWTEQPPEQLRDFIKEVQDRDPFVASRRHELSNGTAHDGYTFDQDDLLRVNSKVWIPRCEPLKLEILKRNHDDDVGGHHGVIRTRKSLQAKYEWNGLARDVQDYARRHKPYGLLQPLEIPVTPHRHFSMDFITGLPAVVRKRTDMKDKTYDAVLVVVDRFSKYARYFPCSKTIDAPALADILWRNIALQTGPLHSIVSDRGSLFTSDYWRTFCFQLNVIRRMSTAFHPQSDGQTERQNQTLENFLRTYCGLEVAAWSFNSKVYSTTGKSPMELHTGVREDSIDGIRADPPPLGGGEENAPPDELAVAHLERMQQSRTLAHDMMLQAQATQQEHYNKKRQEQSFKVGDKVLLSAKNLRTQRPSRKLSSKYLGPFEVIERKGLLAYKLALPQSMSRIHNTFHVALLELFRGRPGHQPEAVPEMDEDFGEDNRYEVEQIVDHRSTRGGTTQYRVRWLGYIPEEDS
ncbi:hypothetical protein B0A50_00741 [Salinomyces thailandicus]|uniref:Reverse transcriptase n=1 Tax=Salinomyces thailandicus TaxID=706561 RepID=A0A4U0UCM0_9PEZI|nr:hypothetical protein B0A50_00741 [Salinomyces thailandica]